MTWREYWKWYWNVTFWFVLIGSPLGLLIFLGGQFYLRFVEPEPIETKYACQKIDENNCYNGFLYKSKNKALSDISKYKRKQIVRINYYPSKLVELEPDEKIYVIRYLKDSTLARIKIVDEIHYNDTTYKKGWIPKVLLHDSICSQGHPIFRYKIDDKRLTTANISKLGDSGLRKVSTFNQNYNGLTSWVLRNPSLLILANRCKPFGKTLQT